MNKIRDGTKKKFYRTYNIVDIDTGEIIKKINNKEYKTVNTEITYKNEQYEENGRIKTRTIQNTYRYVKHTGQTKFEI